MCTYHEFHKSNFLLKIYLNCSQEKLEILQPFNYFRINSQLVPISTKKKYNMIQLLEAVYFCN